GVGSGSGFADRDADGGSDGIGAALAGPDADHVLERVDEALAVADPTGVGRLHDGPADLVDHVLAAGDLELDLGQEVADVLGAAVELGVALLAPEALHLRHRHALHTDALQGLLHLVQLERLDDRLDLAHGGSSHPDDI